MTAQSPYLYIRALRQVDHTVFCVAAGQKFYRDPVFNQKVPYSSGQQVKHSVLDELATTLSEPRAPVVFNWTLTGKGDKRTLSEGEAWSACDPSFADQLIGGWMKASKDADQGTTIKRRSPLSISAMRPLHPLLSGLDENELGTFDRSGQESSQHKIRVLDEDKKEVPQEALMEYLRSNNRTIPLRKFLPSDQLGPRAAGLFVYDVAIDSRTLFSVSTNQFEPELAPATIAKLQADGWKEAANGQRLVCPAERREGIIGALAHSLIGWRITSNQSRTYSPQNTLAIAISDNANCLGAAIRADLDEESGRRQARPILEPVDGVSLFTALTAKGYIPEVVGSAQALEEAEAELTRRLNNYDYDA